MVDKIKLDSNEGELGSWNVKYYPPIGGTLTGKLTITDKRLMLDHGVTDLPPRKGMQVQGLLNGEGHLSIPREEIASAAAEGALRKKLIIWLNDGQKHVFETGLMFDSEIVDALAGKTQEAE